LIFLAALQLWQCYSSDSGENAKGYREDVAIALAAAEAAGLSDEKDVFFPMTHLQDVSFNPSFARITLKPSPHVPIA
jgi:hypothetical protein